MRRYLDAGLLERFCPELQHRAPLKPELRFREVTISRFFAFYVSHLMSAFVVLLVGTFFSSVVFTAELILKSLYKAEENFGVQQ